MAEYVKDKATPYAAKTADALRQKAIDVTKKVLDNLEKDQKNTD